MQAISRRLIIFTLALMLLIPISLPSVGQFAQNSSAVAAVNGGSLNGNTGT